MQNLHGFGGGLLKGLDAIGSAIAPARMQQIPGTTLHHQTDIHRARTAAEEENREIASQGEEQVRGAQAGHIQAQTDQIRNPNAQPKPKEEEWSVVPNVVGPNGEAVQQEKNSGQIRVANTPGVTVKDKAEQIKPAHISYDSGIPVSVTDSKGQVFDVNDPKMPEELKPLVQAANRAHGQHVGEDAHKQASAFAQQEKMFQEHQAAPTAQMRNVGAQAQVAADGIPSVINEISDMKAELGPVAGRWNDFMQGKIGLDNPKFAGLRADMLMMSSAVALAHARGRLPENLREEFDRMINAPQQSPDNIIAVLTHIQPWMQRMGDMGKAPGAGGKETPAAAPSTGGLTIKRDANGRIVGVE